MTVTSTGISSSALLSYYQAKAGLGAATSGGSNSAATSAAASAPTAPWTTTATARQTNSLIQAAMSGQSLFNPNAVKVSVPNASPNYKNLFALYQGVTALQDLANQASASGVTASQITQLQAAFSGGLGQLSSFLGATPFRGFSVAQGAVTTQATTTAGVTAETDTYTTGVLVAGSPATDVAAFDGNVQFSMTATLPSGVQKVVNFNLADMGATPRSLSNVVSYLNSQLSAAGITTRFAVDRIPGQATTTKVNGQTLTTPAGPDTFALQINGNAVEKLSFAAPGSTPAVYLTQTAGITATAAAATSSTTKPDAVQQLVKLTTDPTAANAQVFKDTLASTVKSAITTATGPDGSLYVLANVTGATPAGEADAAQPIVGTQDVALMKYDSAGNLMYSQVLGASGAATGYGLAVSSTGQVAITGTATKLVTGDGTASSATTSTGFVSLYSDQGQPLWTSMVGTGEAGQVNDAAFGADGSVYVTGTTTIPGSTITNGYLAGFNGVTGAQKFSTSLGSDSQTHVTGMAISGSQIVLAGAQGADGIVQSYQIQSTGAPTLTATRDLGDLQGGSVAGVAINDDGSILVAGSTHNGSLNAGTITNAYAGGEEGFVANLSADLTPSSSDTLAYYGGSGGDVRVTAVTAAGGQAYIAGQVVNTSSGTTAYDGFAAQIDPTTGAVGWSDQYSGLDHTVAPNSISVDASGSSVLDALGLPSGQIDFSRSQTVAASTLPGASNTLIPAQTLVANSALRAGEQFTVKTNFSGVAQTVTIEASDTLQTLAQKISQASGFSAAVTVTTGAGGVQALQIKPNYPGVQISLGAGKNGANALGALGLTEGTITTNATAKAAKAGAAISAANANSLQANYALLLPSTLNLSTSAGVKQAVAVLGAAVVTIKQIYSDMTTAPSTAKTNAQSTAPPAYLTAEIASYKAALARLQSAS